MQNAELLLHYSFVLHSEFLSSLNSLCRMINF